MSDHRKQFPFEGEYFPASEKKFQELIFFVHFYGGNKKNLKRHIDMVNSFGFDAFAFNLYQLPKRPSDLKLSSKKEFGLKSLHSDQIEELLNMLPGRKIIYAFSNPSGAAIHSIVRRNFSDVTALVCDSGPSGALLNSIYKYIKQSTLFKNSIMQLLAAPVVTFTYSPFFHYDLHLDLPKFPETFPILSIRGWKDPLISPEQIDQVFSPHKNLNWQKLSLPMAEHLNGLRDFASDYISGVQNFLFKVANKI